MEEDKKENLDKKDKKKNKSKKKQKLYYTILISVLVLAILGVAGTVFFKLNNKDNEEEKPNEDELAYTELIKKITATEEIEKIEMETGSTSLKVKLKDVEKEKDAVVPNIQAFIELVQEEVRNGKEIELIQKPQSMFIIVLDKIFGFLPILMMGVLVVAVFYLQGFGDKGKIYGGEEDNDTGITFDDVAGLDEEKKN